MLAMLGPSSDQGTVKDSILKIKSIIILTILLSVSRKLSHI